MAEEAAIRVLEASNPANALGIDNGAQPAVVRKAYRRLAMLLHPDKCALPDAEQAFKKLSQAFHSFVAADASTTAPPPAPAPPVVPPMKPTQSKAAYTRPGGSSSRAYRVKAAPPPRAPAQAARAPTSNQATVVVLSSGSEAGGSEEESEESEEEDVGLLCADDEAPVHAGSDANVPGSRGAKRKKGEGVGGRNKKRPDAARKRVPRRRRPADDASDDDDCEWGGLRGPAWSRADDPDWQGGADARLQSEPVRRSKRRVARRSWGTLAGEAGEESDVLDELGELDKGRGAGGESGEERGASWMLPSCAPAKPNTRRWPTLAAVLLDVGSLHSLPRCAAALRRHPNPPHSLRTSHAGTA